MSIPESFIQDLLNRTNVEDVVGQYVKLKKSGVNLFGLCPFHNEKSPSFSVSPQKQIFHCFSCGQSGNAIGFVMKHLGLSFPEAVKMLAGRVGMQVPEERPQTPAQRAQAIEQKSKSDYLHDCLEKAQKYFVQQLKQSPQAIDYLKGRGLSGEIAKKFGLGWSGTERQGLKSVFENYDDSNLVEAGLVIQNEDLRKYDRFRERVTFPIYNTRGKIIGFGGRIIGNGQPKYLNSPETPIFHKGSELYGLFENRSTINKEGFVLVVEGYMDVVSLAQLGLANAVATLGTATSEEHIKKLMRVTHKIVFSFDGDKAGRRAAWKALTISLPLLRDDIAIRFLFLPEEHDPDTYIREFGQAQFREQIEQSLSLSGFLISELQHQFNLNEIEGRTAGLHEIRPLLVSIPESSMMRLQIEKEIAKVLLLTHDELKHDLQQYQHNQSTKVVSRADGYAPEIDQTAAQIFSDLPYARDNRKTHKKTTRNTMHQVDPLGMRIFRLVIHHPEILKHITDRQIELLSQQGQYQLVAEFLALCLRESSAELRVIQPKLEGMDEIQRIVSAVSHDSLSQQVLDDPLAEWQGVINKVEIESLTHTINQLMLEGLQDDSQKKRYRLLLERLKNLKKASI
ncbi:DNA primase [Pelistega sp. MC2]|uniref:DNA primase n=1 Tax=Pelistega sp. MC2 TaxID=1720297 RepID=UPI0008DA9024|nr:DNA primase [Pelistega sp. MC2]